MTELVAQSVHHSRSSLPAEDFSRSAYVVAACSVDSLLRRASEWCLPRAAVSSIALVFSGANHYAAAECVAWLAQHTADRQLAARLFLRSTALAPQHWQAWQGVEQSMTDAANLQLAARLREHHVSLV